MVRLFQKFRKLHLICQISLCKNSSCILHRYIEHEFLVAFITYYTFDVALWRWTFCRFTVGNISYKDVVPAMWCQFTDHKPHYIITRVHLLCRSIHSQWLYLYIFNTIIPHFSKTTHTYCYDITVTQSIIICITIILNSLNNNSFEFYLKFYYKLL